ncbi:MAG: hypothetical protein HQ543_09410 [Bacteroidetes bacterium]|nr:hypothetical protein [Bacteroidota bacterium]
MKTSLAKLFKYIFSIQEQGDHGFIHWPMYNSYLQNLINCPESKIRCYINHPSDLWRIPKVALLLTDIVIITGAEPGKEQWKAPEPGIPDAPTHFFESTPEGQYLPCFFSFEDELIGKWVKEVKDFVLDGRLMYEPTRSFMRVKWTEERVDWEFLDKTIVSSVPWSTWQAVQEAARSSEVNQLHFDENELMKQEGWENIIDFAMPYIAKIPFELLYKIMLDEKDTFTNFRGAISRSLNECRNSSSRVENKSELRNIGLEIRRDILDPELSKLELRLKKIVQMRSIKIAGAFISTVGLFVSAITGIGLQSIVSGALGAGGVGLFLNQLAEYRSDIMSLRENPWYFAWKLKKLALK